LIVYAELVSNQRCVLGTDAEGDNGPGVANHGLAQQGRELAERYTIADIALYAYTHVAHEGGFDLAPYQAVRAWLERVRAQPRHVPITQSAFA
jgi:glutathione S-transferase